MKTTIISLALFLTSCVAQTPIQIPAPASKAVCLVSSSFTVPTTGSTISFTLPFKPTLGSKIFAYRGSELILIANVGSTNPQILEISGGVNQGEVLTFVYSTAD